MCRPVKGDSAHLFKKKNRTNETKNDPMIIFFYSAAIKFTYEFGRLQSGRLLDCESVRSTVPWVDVLGRRTRGSKCCFSNVHIPLNYNYVKHDPKNTSALTNILKY